MPDNKEMLFPDGLIVREPSSQAPDFIIGSIGVNAERFSQWVEKHKNDRGWAFFTIKKSKKGGLYIHLDTWKPKQPEQKAEEPQEDYEKIPF